MYRYQEQPDYSEPQQQHLGMIEPVTGAGIVKGAISTGIGMLGLSVFWTDVGEGVKLGIGIVSLLSMTFFLCSGIYDRFFKPKRRHRK